MNEFERQVWLTAFAELIKSKPVESATLGARTAVEQFRGMQTPAPSVSMGHSTLQYTLTGKPF